MVRPAIVMTLGDVAQLAERFVRNEEVVGSIPIISTGVMGSETRGYGAGTRRNPRRFLLGSAEPHYRNLTVCTGT